MYIYSKLKKNAKNFPNKNAIILDDKQISYSQLLIKVDKLILFFRKLKL